MTDRFDATARPPRQFIPVGVAEWRRAWNKRLRPYLIGEEARGLYREIVEREDTQRFGDLALIGIGYVSGANDFFHLRPSQALRWEIPERFLHPSVRNGRVLPSSTLTTAIVERWKHNDDAVLLLHLPKTENLPRSVGRYLETEEGRAAREAYKCRVREPWYSVPDVQVPDFFLSYMSGLEPSLVRNDARCTCTNSVHGVRLKPGTTARALSVWGSEFVQLSCELQGHPLGGRHAEALSRAKQLRLHFQGAQFSTNKCFSDQRGDRRHAHVETLCLRSLTTPVNGLIKRPP